jgi:hypothetical protein
LIYLNNIEKKRSIAFVLSDFKADGYLQALTIAAKRHDIIGIRMYDHRETQLPDVGLLQVKDAESGQMRYIDTSDAIVRKAYATHYEEQYQRFKKDFAFAKSDTVSISTADDYIKAMQVFFKQRARR